MPTERTGKDTDPYKIPAFVGADVPIGPSSPNTANPDRAGAQYPQGARRIRKAAKPPTAALCAPLHTVYQSIPVDGGAARRGVAAYGDWCKTPKARHRQARRHLRHRANEVTIKSRGQVVAREAERQRMFIASLKTGGRSQDTFCFARATAAALGRQGWMSGRLSRGRTSRGS